MKPSELFAQLTKIAKARFGVDFDCNSIRELDLFKFPFQKIATLRDLCLCVGLVLERKNYDIIECGNQLNDKIFPFNPKNIVSIDAKAKRMKVEPPNLRER